MTALLDVLWTAGREPEEGYVALADVLNADGVGIMGWEVTTARPTSGVSETDRREPTRLLVCVGEFPVASQTFVYNQVVDLLNRGYAIDLLAIRPGLGPRVLHGSVQRILADANVVFAKTGRERWIQSIQAVLGWIHLARKSIRKSVRLAMDPGSPFNVIRHANSVFVANAIANLRPPFAVLCHFGPVGAVLARARASGWFDAPLVTFFHGYDATRYVSERGRGTYRQLFQQSDALISNSEFMRGLLGDLGAPVDRIRVIPPGIDLQLFQEVSRHTESRPVVRFLNVGRCVEGKGQIFLIQAFAGLIGSGVRASLDIVGEGPLLPFLKSEVNRLGLSEQVIFHGALCQESVRALMKESDVFVLPSISEHTGSREGLGLVLVEAQASGLPVIGSRSGGIPEAMSPDVSGLLVPERDEVGLREAMRSLALSAEDRSAMGRAGRKFVESKFDQRRLNAALLQLLFQLGGDE